MPWNVCGPSWMAVLAMSEQAPSKEISESRLLNTRAWARARPDMSGSEVIVGAIDELLARRAAHEPPVGDDQIARYVRALNEPAKAFQYCHPDTIRELTALLAELQTRRAGPPPPAVPPGCKQCPWTVGDTYQRDCGYPDCSPGTAPPPAVTLPDAVLNVAELLHTQDNRITANPLFAVEVKRRVYGIDPEWGGPVVWLHDGEEVTDQDEIKQLEQNWENGDDDPDNHTRTSYHEHWEFVTACFTEEGCKAYLRSNGHNHRGEKRIYAHSGFRNREWEELRRYLMSLRPVPTKGGDAP